MPTKRQCQIEAHEIYHGKGLDYTLIVIRSINHHAGDSTIKKANGPVSKFLRGHIWWARNILRFILAHIGTPDAWRPFIIDIADTAVATPLAENHCFQYGMADGHNIR
ncbi:hypothetical protein TNCV_1070451 [Trichonephila clavipes]|nr:hypothetical protein TNCV_1070451 [Trichonephila clavipes]